MLNLHPKTCKLKQLKDQFQDNFEVSIFIILINLVL